MVRRLVGCWNKHVVRTFVAGSICRNYTEDFSKCTDLFREAFSIELLDDREVTDVKRTRRVRYAQWSYFTPRTMDKRVLLHNLNGAEWFGALEDELKPSVFCTEDRSSSKKQERNR